VRTSILALFFVVLAARAACEQTGACCFADGTCQVTTEAECATDLWIEGEVCDPNPCPQPNGACCDIYLCTVTTEAECEEQDQWHGAGTVCDPNPCVPMGICCLAGPPYTCTHTTEAECPIPNLWAPEDIDCQPINPCLPMNVGACCLLNGMCVQTTRDNCEFQPDYCFFAGHGVSCDIPGLCGDCADPVKETTWGRIKAIYR